MVYIFTFPCILFNSVASNNNVHISAIFGHLTEAQRTTVFTDHKPFSRFSHCHLYKSNHLSYNGWHTARQWLRQRRNSDSSSFLVAHGAVMTVVVRTRRLADDSRVTSRDVAPVLPRGSRRPDATFDPIPRRSSSIRLPTLELPHRRLQSSAEVVSDPASITPLFLLLALWFLSNCRNYKLLLIVFCIGYI